MWLRNSMYVALYCTCLNVCIDATLVIPSTPIVRARHMNALCANLFLRDAYTMSIICGVAPRDPSWPYLA